MGLLADACESYRLAYERDQSMTDTEVLRAAYLIGDLYFRLDQPAQVVQFGQLAG